MMIFIVDMPVGPSRPLAVRSRFGSPGPFAEPCRECVRANSCEEIQPGTTAGAELLTWSIAGSLIAALFVRLEGSFAENQPEGSFLFLLCLPPLRGRTILAPSATRTPAVGSRNAARSAMRLPIP
jgi:hypothetical protein